MKFNYSAFKAIYLHEMDRFKRTLMQSLLSPVLSTSLYFIVFGSVIGGYVENIDGISYGSYIVPGLLMLTLLTQSISNTSFGIFFPKFNGTIYDIPTREGGTVSYTEAQKRPFYIIIIGDQKEINQVNLNSSMSLYLPRLCLYNLVHLFHLAQLLLH